MSGYKARCGVRKCNNTRSKGYQIFGMPVSYQTRLSWEKLIKKQTTPFSKICEVQFEDSDFCVKNVSGKSILKANAQPTLLCSLTENKDKTKNEESSQVPENHLLYEHDYALPKIDPSFHRKEKEKIPVHELSYPFRPQKEQDIHYLSPPPMDKSSASFSDVVSVNISMESDGALVVNDQNTSPVIFQSAPESKQNKQTLLANKIMDVKEGSQYTKNVIQSQRPLILETKKTVRKILPTTDKVTEGPIISEVYSLQEESSTLPSPSNSVTISAATLKRVRNATHRERFLLKRIQVLNRIIEKQKQDHERELAFLARAQNLSILKKLRKLWPEEQVRMLVAADEQNLPNESIAVSFKQSSVNVVSPAKSSRKQSISAAPRTYSSKDAIKYYGLEDLNLIDVCNKFDDKDNNDHVNEIKKKNDDRLSGADLNFIDVCSKFDDNDHVIEIKKKNDDSLSEADLNFIDVCSKFNGTDNNNDYINEVDPLLI